MEAEATGGPVDERPKERFIEPNASTPAAPIPERIHLTQ